MSDIRPVSRIFITIPMFVPSSANLREHHHAKARRVKRERQLAGWILGTQVRGWVPATITMTRIGPRRLDSDNLAHALKPVQDGIADALGVDDGDPRLLWVREQSVGRMGLHVEIVRSEGTSPRMGCPAHGLEGCPNLGVECSRVYGVAFVRVPKGRKKG